MLLNEKKDDGCCCSEAGRERKKDCASFPTETSTSCWTMWCLQVFFWLSNRTTELITLLNVPRVPSTPQAPWLTVVRVFGWLALSVPLTFCQTNGNDHLTFDHWTILPSDALIKPESLHFYFTQKIYQLLELRKRWQQHFKWKEVGRDSTKSWTWTHLPLYKHLDLLFRSLFEALLCVSLATPPSLHHSVPPGKSLLLLFISYTDDKTISTHMEDVGVFGAWGWESQLSFYFSMQYWVTW